MWVQFPHIRPIQTNIIHQKRRKHNGKETSRSEYPSIVLYRHDVLVEGNDAETDCDWEIISINARLTEGDEPINPAVLMHNHFGSDGGTATNMTDSELVSQLKESFLYWKDKAMLSPSS